MKCNRFGLLIHMVYQQVKTPVLELHHKKLCYNTRHKQQKKRPTAFIKTDGLKDGKFISRLS